MDLDRCSPYLSSLDELDACLVCFLFPERVCQVDNFLRSTCTGDGCRRLREQGLVVLLLSECPHLVKSLVMVHGANVSAGNLECFLASFDLAPIELDTARYHN